MIFANQELTNMQLEALNIIYDIYIDEERYTEVDVYFDNYDIILELNSLINNDLYQSGDVTCVLYKYETKGNMLIDKKVIPTNCRDLWRCLFIAKKVRSILQGNGSTDALKLIDEVADYLLSRVPKIYNEFWDNKIRNIKDEKPEEFRRKKFLILFYNEISQCYLGYLNTGFAQKALKYFSDGECHYELLGLYNKALGLAHHENKKSREKALRYYDEIIKPFKDNDNNLGYNYKIDVDLWKMYVYYPAIFHKADVLIKLQRSKESIEILKELENLELKYPIPNLYHFTFDYKKIDGIILMTQAMIESSAEQPEIDKKIDIINNIIDKYQWQKQIINNKYLSLQSKSHIEKVRNGLLNKKSEELYVDLKKAFNICEKLFKETKNREERIQAANYWLDAYLLFLKTEEKSRNMSKEVIDDKKLIITLKDIIELIFSTINPTEEKVVHDPERWIPIKGEILKLLVKVLEEVNKCDVTITEMVEIEKECCKHLSHRTNKPSNYTKVKLNRRRLLLGECSNIIDKNYHFPDNFNLVREFVDNGINKDFYSQRLNYNTESFDKNLIYSSHWPQFSDRYVFTILRKWQSYTPSLSSYSTNSRGGGYFIYKVGKEGQVEEGIVIDPGYDFIENFIEYNFSIRDISAIALTHSHIDHSVDFRGLITLIHEMNKRGSKKQYNWTQRKVTILTTPSWFDHIFQTLKESRKCIKDVIVVDPDSQKENEPFLVKLGEYFSISAVPAYHEDLQEGANCVGLIVGKRDGEKLLGFTGDTVWTNTLAQNLKGCTVVCVNMGAVIDIRKGDSFEKIFKQGEDKNIKNLIYNENHLYLPGIITLLEELRLSESTKLTVVGELGEELKSDLRRDLFYNLNKFYRAKYDDDMKCELRKKYLNPKPLQVAIEDIGLTITWEQRNEPFIRCIRCKNIIRSNSIMLRVTEDGRKSEQLYYYCKRCLNKVESLEDGVRKNWEKRYFPPQQV